LIRKGLNKTRRLRLLSLVQSQGSLQSAISTT
jgi:hypothetical protein